jgi:predicted metalloprotease with PDZ domain
LSGLDLKPFFAEAVHGTGDLDLARLLKPFAIRLQRSASSRAPTLGVKIDNEGHEVRLCTVYDGSPAQAAGLSSGDLLLAIDGLRVSSASLEALLSRRKPGQTVTVHAFRRDELMAFTLQLGAPASDRHALRLTRKANPLRQDWLPG